MATVEVKGEIVGLVFGNKGVQILETFKSKDGEKRDARYTAWLDISPKGVSKASALEVQRQRLGIANHQVLVMGDGRNDIEMFQWAKANGGLAFAMGQAPEEVQLEATDITSSVTDDGVARVLAGLEGILFSRQR